MVTFTDIVKEQRQQGAGVFSSLGKAAGQRTLERIDPRNYLFKRSGLLTALFPGLKGYQAKGGSSEMKSSGASSSLGQTNLVIDKLDELKVVQQETAKNTLVLPIIARDMNVMRQNILKLVKLSGGKPSSRADSFFMSARDRESAYESRFGKKSISPTAINSKDGEKEKSGVLSSLLDGLKMIGGGLLAAYLLSDKFREMVNGFLNSLFETILGPENWKAIKETISNSIRGIKDSIMKSAGIDPQKIDRTMDVVKQGGKAAAVGAGALLANKYIKPIGESTTRGGIKTKEFGKKTKRVATNIEKSALRGELTTIFKKIAKKPSMWKAFLSALAQKFGITTILKLGAVGIMAAGAAATGVGMVVSWIIISVNYLTILEILKFTYAWYNLNKDEDDTSPTPVDKSANNQIGREVDTSDTTPSMLVSPTSKDSGSLEKAEEYLGRTMSEDEKDALQRAVSAESSMNPTEYANVMAVILNRARNSNKSIIDVLQEKNQFQSVTGTANNPGPSENFKRGPNPAQRGMILESTNSLSSISKSLDAFTSANPQAYGPGTNIDYLDKLKNSGGKQIGQTVFAENQYSGGSKSSMTLASAASAMPNINDMGKFLNQGSADFEAMVRDFLASSGIVNINNDSSTKVSTTNASQDGPPGSAYDSDMFTAMVDSAVNY
jgi:hypothetical protein